MSLMNHCDNYFLPLTIKRMVILENIGFVILSLYFFGDKFLKWYNESTSSSLHKCLRNQILKE